MISWPGGAMCAATFTFDVDAEEVWLAEDPENARRPGVLSQGRYGPKVGVPWILELLSVHDIRATFFVPGRVAERYPDRIRSILDEGHEIAHHGYTHRSVDSLEPGEEAHELDQGLAALTGLGAEVRGYRSPSWDLTDDTLRLLAERGLAYSSNLMDDVVPYVHEGTPLVELPVSWTLDDAPHLSFDVSTWEKTIVPNDHVKRLWLDEFEGIRRMGGAFVLTMHPQLIGRPGRLLLLEDMLREIRGRDDVWIATAREIAAVASP
jgi:peptidoglycan/xylan/chitin deacetylase (PgdA/CDA1 family)